MIADIAHELRTPLTVIQGNLRAILDLGRAIAERLVTLHGGKIRVTSEIGKSLTFWFGLPTLNAGAEK